MYARLLTLLMLIPALILAVNAASVARRSTNERAQDDTLPTYTRLM